MDEEREVKARVEISGEDHGMIAQTKGSEEEDWSFLVPIAIPVVAVLILAGLFGLMKGQGGDVPSLDMSVATQSGQVAGKQQQQQKKIPLGPAVPPSPSQKPSPSVSPSPSPMLSPSPSASPSPSPTASPSQSPSPSPSSTPSS